MVAATELLKKEASMVIVR
ncbi:hypothetical protein [Staphylococcus chromogenes]|nr:hypothetical protein [Staphylococcus chromogenes]